MAVDKNKAVIDFLLTCDLIRNSPLYFNFVDAKDKSKEFVTSANDKVVDRPFIDGSVLRRYTFTIQDYRAIAFDALRALNVENNENVEDMLDFQGFIDWITEQAATENFPNFGEDCRVESMIALTSNPNMNGIQNIGGLDLAKYSVSVQIEYLDLTQTIWN